MDRNIQEKYEEFMEALGWCESPLAAYYSDTKPRIHTGPDGGFFINITKPGDVVLLSNKVKQLKQQKKEKFRCLFQFLGQTRKKNIPSVFDDENYGCPGSRYYLGFIQKLPEFNHHFISTGFPLLYNGERLAPSPESSKKHADLLGGIQPKGKYIIFDILKNILPDVTPELVIFFCNAEILTGLVGLIRFVTDKADTVQAPFAPGCGSIFSWPVKYLQQGMEKAVLGVFDPAARPYLLLGEMTISMPYSLFLKLLACYKKSFLYVDKIKGRLIKKAIPGWPDVRKRAKRFQKLTTYNHSQ